MNFKRIFIFLIIGLSLTNMTIAQDTQPKGDYFGNAKFGSTRDEIKEVEKNSKLIFDTKDEMVFNETSEFIGNSQNIYNFDEDGKMESAMISIVNDHKDLANYINDYNKLNESFTKVYGEPSQSVYTTEDKELLNNPAKLAEAIKEGKVVATTIWNKENFTISHILADAMDPDDMEEDVRKVTIITPISHIVLGQLNLDDEEEVEDISDSDTEDEEDKNIDPEDEAESDEEKEENEPDDEDSDDSESE